MTGAGADSLLIYVYGLTALGAHLLISLGQTLFHRYLGHNRLGGRFFKNHIQFHHAHYAGDHVVSTRYLDNGDNNTLFFLFPVFLIVGLSYLFLRLDLLVVQFAAMSLSFCGHYYLDNQSWRRGREPATSGRPSQRCRALCGIFDQTEAFDPHQCVRLGWHRMVDEWEGVRSWVIHLRPRSCNFHPASERWTKWVLGWFPRLSFLF